MATKRFSVFLGFNDPKETNIAELGIEGKRSRRFSLQVGTATEKETIDDGSSVFTSEEGKRLRRFSQLFTGASASHSDKVSQSGEEKSIESKEENDVLAMVFKFFVRPSRQGKNHQRNVSTVSFKPSPRKAAGIKKDRVKITVNIRPFWKTRKDGQALMKESVALSISPPQSRTPTVRTSRKGKSRANSLCDSKFSSLSSALSSFTSLPHELLSLTTSQCSILLHLIRKLGRSLQNQERLTANFSTNLAFLFAHKERIVDGNKRLSRDLRKMLLQMMTGLRELVGRTFLKKAVFTQRSLQLVHDLSEVLQQGPRYKIQEVHGTDSVVGLLPPIDAGNRMSIAVSEINASTVSLVHSAEPEQTIDIHHFQHSLQLVRDDITVQRQLDAALRAGIVGPCEDARFPATVSERIAMKRFIGFVDMSLGCMDRRYAQEDNVARALEMLGRVLKGEEGVAG